MPDYVNENNTSSTSQLLQGVYQAPGIKKEKRQGKKEKK